MASDPDEEIAILTQRIHGLFQQIQDSALSEASYDDLQALYDNIVRTVGDLYQLVDDEYNGKVLGSVLNALKKINYSYIVGGIPYFQEWMKGIAERLRHNPHISPNIFDNMEKKHQWEYFDFVGDEVDGSYPTNDQDFCERESVFCYRKRSLPRRCSVPHRDCDPAESKIQRDDWQGEFHQYTFTAECDEWLDRLVVRYKLIGRYSQLAGQLGDTKWGTTLKKLLEKRQDKTDGGSLDVQLSIMIKTLFPKTLPFSKLTSAQSVFIPFPDVRMKNYDYMQIQKLLDYVPRDVIKRQKNAMKFVELCDLAKRPSAITQDRVKIKQARQDQKDAIDILKGDENRQAWIDVYSKIQSDLYLNANTLQQRLRNFARLIQRIEQNRFQGQNGNLLFDWIQELYEGAFAEYGEPARDLFVGLLSLKMYQMDPVIPIEDIQPLNSYIQACDVLKIMRQTDQFPVFNTTFSINNPQGAFCLEETAYVFSSVLLREGGSERERGTFLGAMVRDATKTVGNVTDQDILVYVVTFLVGIQKDLVGLLQYKDRKVDISAKPGNLLRLILLFTSEYNAGVHASQQHDNKRSHALSVLSKLAGVRDSDLFDMVKESFPFVQITEQEGGSSHQYAIHKSRSSMTAKITPGHAEIQIEIDKFPMYTSTDDRKAVIVLENIYSGAIRDADLLDMSSNCKTANGEPSRECDTQGMYFVGSRPSRFAQVRQDGDASLVAEKCKSSIDSIVLYVNSILIDTATYLAYVYKTAQDPKARLRDVGLIIAMGFDPPHQPTNQQVVDKAKRALKLCNYIKDEILHLQEEVENDYNRFREFAERVGDLCALAAQFDRISKKQNDYVHDQLKKIQQMIGFLALAGQPLTV